MVFILTQALKPPQTLSKSQLKSYPASHQNLARSAHARQGPGMGQPWASHGPAHACPMAKLPSHVAWQYLSFHYSLKAVGLNLIILIGKIIENIKTFI